MIIAVTGATGFIGKYLLKALHDSGHQLVALGRDAYKLKKLNSACLKVLSTDYSLESLCEALDQVDAVVHLAGPRMSRDDDPLLLTPFLEPNIQMVDNIIRAAQEVTLQNVIFASSRSVYSPANRTPYQERYPAKPLNAYGLSKLFAEQYLDLLARNTTIKVTILRIATAYGHGERFSPVLMKFIKLARNGHQLEIIGDINLGIEQIYIRDIVDSVLMSLGEANPGGIFNIGPGCTHTLLEMAEMVNEVFDNKGNLIVSKTQSDSVIRQYFMDTTHTSSILGWKACWTLRDGLEDFRTTWLYS